MAKLPKVESIDLELDVREQPRVRLERFPQLVVREVKFALDPPWVRAVPRPTLEIACDGWRFPEPVELTPSNRPEPASATSKLPSPEASAGHRAPDRPIDAAAKQTKLQPPRDAVVLKDRLLYVLQPPLESVFAGKQVELPFPPYPYQLEGIAFLMPRHAALLADEMGLGKTMQTIVALRLMFHAGLVRRALLVCPKPLVPNWSRELRQWASDLPFEVIGGNADSRRAGWQVSNCPLKLVNYELLTRDADLATDEATQFDVVVLDEAQRIKNRESKTAQVVRQLRRHRSWALTGTPIENRPEDLVNIFDFVDAERIPPNTPARHIPRFTSDCILRRTKDDVLTDLPPKTIHDSHLELTPAQREAYDLAEKEGVVHLDSLGETITVQHVFELVMRLKQICNFDPRTGQSAKLEQLQADLAEIAESGRKAIVFSQWVEPLQHLSKVLAPFGPLEYHGKIPTRERQPILDRFKSDPSKHVILMSYGTGSVGLNLQFTNYVFLFDRWWNPAVEDQAINRAHRIGQREPVFVKRFVSINTIEGRIAEVLQRKRDLFNELIEQNGPPPNLGLTEEDVFGLFDIAARPRRAAA